MKQIRVCAPPAFATDIFGTAFTWTEKAHKHYVITPLIADKRSHLLAPSNGDP